MGPKHLAALSFVRDEAERVEVSEDCFQNGIVYGAAESFVKLVPCDGSLCALEDFLHALDGGQRRIRGGDWHA